MPAKSAIMIHSMASRAYGVWKRPRLLARPGSLAHTSAACSATARTRASRTRPRRAAICAHTGQRSAVPQRARNCGPCGCWNEHVHLQPAVVAVAGVRIVPGAFVLVDAAPLLVQRRRSRELATRSRTCRRAMWAARATPRRAASGGSSLSALAGLERRAAPILARCSI